MASSRSLDKYKDKRKFDKTPEPTGGGSEAKQLVYVIQKHDATRLHYDLRLEHKGVLLSWAVTKIPSTIPGEKRLAVHVEDHPLDYAIFEGTIPKGNYGAGTVEIWDNGTWEPVNGDIDQALAKGELKIHIHGKRLNGRWVLVRMGDPGEKENWLFIKEKLDHDPVKLNIPKWTDDGLPKHQLSELRAQLPSGEDWRYEIKWDGYRAFLLCVGGHGGFVSRNGNDLGEKEFANELAKAIGTEAIIDGELVVLNEEGRSNFGLLQAELGIKSDQVRFVAFDILRVNALDLRGLELRKRIEFLERVLSGKLSHRLMLSPAIEGDPASILRTARDIGLEGIVAKKLSSKYSGRRNSDWVKAKCRHADGGLVIGYTLLTGTSNEMGALVIGERKDGKLQFMGRVGTGFSHPQRSEWFKRLKPMEIDRAEVEGLTSEERRGVRWVKPEIAIEVEVSERTNKGILRQASFIREQKPGAIQEEPAMPDADGESPRPRITGVKLSNPDRVIDPNSGLAKKHLFDFYAEFGGQMMPYLDGRLLAMVRSPDGIEGESFFQKAMMQGTYKGFKEIPDEDHKFVTVSSEIGILEAAQMGVIEFHPWGSQYEDVECPDILIFDLDPGPELEWREILDEAEFVRKRLESIGLNPFYKLSGGKGIHFVISIEPELEWPAAKNLCKSLAERIASERPKRFVSVQTKEKRVGKIYIDYLRNGRGATAVAPYSVRAKPGLPIAMPVSWEELLASQSSGQYNLANAAAYLNKRKSDPWEGFFESRQSLIKLLGL